MEPRPKWIPQQSHHRPRTLIVVHQINNGTLGNVFLFFSPRVSLTNGTLLGNPGEGVQRISQSGIGIGIGSSIAVSRYWELVVNGWTMENGKQITDHEGKQRNKKGVTCLCLNVVKQEKWSAQLKQQCRDERLKERWKREKRMGGTRREGRCDVREEGICGIV